MASQFPSQSHVVPNQGSGVRRFCRYSPGQYAGWGPSVWIGMAGDLLRSRELIWRLFLRDFSARYRQTVLGLGWALLMPILAVGTFLFLRHAGVLEVGEIGFPYAVWALLGMTIFQIFSTGLGACTNSIVSSGSMIVRINFPKETLVLASFGQTLFETLVRLVLVAVVGAAYGVTPAWTVVFFPLALLPILLLTLGLGFLFSLANALVRDVAQLVTIGMMFVLLATPVLYCFPEGGTGGLLDFNPLTPLVETPRGLALHGAILNPVEFTVASVISIVVFLFGWRVFHLAQVRIAERVGAR